MMKFVHTESERRISITDTFPLNLSLEIAKVLPRSSLTLADGGALFMQECKIHRPSEPSKTEKLRYVIVNSGPPEASRRLAD